MSEFEKPTEKSPVLLDKELVAVLSHLDDIIQERIRQAVGDDIYDECTSLAELDRELEDSLSEETEAALRDNRIDSFSSIVAQKAHDMVVDEGRAFDEDEERHLMDHLDSEAVNEILPLFENSHDGLFYEVSGQINEEIIAKIEALLADRYPTFIITNIDQGRITFHGNEKQVDSFTKENLLITFSVDGSDIKTEASYSYIPIDFNLERVKIEPIDVASAGGYVEGISIKNLKEDALKALQIVSEEA